MIFGLPSREEEEAESCYRSFSHFAQSAWAVLEPDTPLLWEPHAHEVVAAHVEELLHGFVRTKLFEVASGHAHGQLPRPGTGLLPFSRRERETALRERARVQHLWAVGQRLEVVLRGGRVEYRPQLFTNLLINQGTGYGKSRLCSVLAPSYLWLLWPSAVEHSYSVNPRGAAKESRAQLALVSSEWWQRTFRPWWGLTLAKPSESRFTNTAKGERKASGWGAQVQGDHADFQIIDDPEDPKKVLSEGERKATQQAWDGRISRRVKPGGTSIRLGVQNRLEPDDWSANWLRTGEVEHVELQTVKEPEPEVPHCPCPTHQRGHTLINWRRSGRGWKDERAPGELLAPRLVPQRDVDSRRKKPLIWAAQDQQRPKSLAGNIFPEERWWYWRFFDEPEVEALKERTIVLPFESRDASTEWPAYFEQGLLSGDLSFGLTQDGSADCIGVWGRRGRRRFLLDVRWEPMTVTRVGTSVRELVARYPWVGPKVLEQAAQASAVQNVLTDGAAAQGKAEVEGIILRVPAGSKVWRAIDIQPAHEAGELVLPLHHHQRQEMVNEAKAFPQQGRRNDFVDMTSQAARYWQEQDAETAGLEHLYPRR